jgi:gamma-glutamylcyclotransferase (GGCT)/AIG2-like uncharacterized protein YtfP
VNTVFVYGLLKPGQRLHHVIAPYVRSLSAASVTGRLFDAGVPAARFDDGGRIEGFVLELTRTDQALEVLDELEDEGTEYRRVTVRVSTSGGDVDAYAYEYMRDTSGLRDVGASWT